VNGEIASEDEVETVLYLLQGIVTTEVDGGSVFLGKLWSHYPGPMVELLANDLRAETVGGGP